MLGILGGGISGLSLAYLYEGESEVLEKEDRVGGHCRSHEKDGFLYDEGGHILFSRDERVLNRMLAVLGDNAAQHYRNNKIWFRGRLVKYPFENGLADLAKEDAFDCLFHFLKNDHAEPANFREWVYYTFGKGIAERYLIPYNEKIWKADPSTISLDWAGGRVPRPPAEDVIRSALGISTEGYTHQLYFWYPQQGGFEALPQAFARAAAPRAGISTGFEVRSVERRGRQWAVGGGSDERVYDGLVSTIPIPELLRALKDVPSDVMEAARALRYNASIFVLLGLERCAHPDLVAVYFPQPELVFNRVCFLHSFSPGCVPPGRYSLLAEISCHLDDEVWRTGDEQIVRRVAGELAHEGFIAERDIVTTDVYRTPYSYVVYDLDYRRHRDKVRAYLEDLGISLLGRFAEFEYLNTDQCFARAEALAERLNGARVGRTSTFA